MELGIFRDSIASKWGDANNYALQKRIENSIISARATIIQRRYDSTKIFPMSIVERVTCKDLITVDETECSCGYDSGIKTLRTLESVPKPLIVKDESYFNFVGRGTKSFSYCPFHQVQDIKYRKFGSKEIYYTYLDNYVYIINANSLKSLDFAYVPENLILFLKYGRCKESACLNNNKVYIEDTFVEGIEALLETRRPAIMAGKPDAEVTLDD